jgi:AAA15 family ATPase/GTPase
LKNLNECSIIDKYGLGGGNAMLLRFSVGNFLSFKEAVEFKMAAGKAQKLSNHVADLGDGKRVLKGGFIFGANASGKSNLVRAMEFARTVIIYGSNIVECSQKHFRIDSAYKDKPGVFHFDIYVDGHYYSYGFAISYKSAEIEEEWLYCLNDGESLIYERARDDDGKMRIEHNMLFKNDKDRMRFELYAEDIDKDEMKKKTFLLDMVMRSSHDSESYQAFRSVIKWFLNLCVAHTYGRYLNHETLLKDDKQRLTFGRLLKYFDTGIESISKSKKDFDEVFSNVTDERKAAIKEDLGKESEMGKESAVIDVNGKRYEFALEEGELTVSEVAYNHGNPEDLFEYRDESDGTRRLFDLLPIYRYVFPDGVFVFDEIDKSLHTKAVREFISLFYDITKEDRSQLIATTHDTNIFDLDFLRQDEIWLVERDRDHSSKLRSLSFYKPIADKEDAGRDYLVGRYGAVPVFDNLSLLAEESGEDDE